MDKKRRIDLLEEAEHFYDQQGGMPVEILMEIDGLEPEDSIDGLDIIVGKMCLPEWGGSSNARSFLSAIGATEEEIEELIGLNFDMYL